MKIPRPIPAALRALAAKKTHPVASPTHSEPQQHHHQQQHQQQANQQQQELKQKQQEQHAAVPVPDKEALANAAVAHPVAAPAQPATGAAHLPVLPHAQGGKEGAKEVKVKEAIVIGECPWGFQL